MNTVKVGVIGAGAVSGSHCSGVAGHESAELVAIADASAERAEEARKKYDIPKTYTSISEIIADRDLDAVTIALPTYLHAPTALAAFDAGKHVLLDKPFAMNRGEAAAVIAAAKEAGKTFCVGMNRRFSEDAQIIRTIVGRGELGDIYHGKAYWLRRSGIPRLGTWFGNREKAGGGVMLDLGVHALDLCLSLMGNFEPETVSGFSYTKFGNRGLGEGGWGSSERQETVFDVDDFAGALIKLSGGVTMQLEVAWALHREQPRDNNVELFGTEAGAQVSPAKIFRYGKNPGEYEVVEPQEVPIRYPHADRVHNWLDAILGDDELECKPEQSLVVQSIIDGIYQSAETGREIVLKEGV